MKCRHQDPDRIIFWCPGCNSHHCVNNRWSFNGDFNKPTFAPSILARGVVPFTSDEYDRVLNGEVIEPIPLICHSFVREGKIEYLSDCTHSLAGQTVELEDLDW